MKRLKSRWYFLLMLLAGCGGPYTRIEQPQYTAANQAYSVQLPVGWVQASLPQKPDVLTFSRDGFSLQSISVSNAKHDKAFPQLKKAVSTTMLATDIAENQLSEIKATNPNPASIQVLENKLVNLSSGKACRLHLRYLNDKGLRFEQVTYGLVGKQYYYTLTYTAPSLHYFPRDKQVFEQVVNSFNAKL